jgi:6-phosphogluconate dehydrogenase
MSLLHFASKEYKFDLNLEDIASIWRGGCIIRSSLLNDIRSVFSKQPDSPNFLLDSSISKKLTHSQIEMRKVIQMGVEAGIPIPGLMNAFSYFDGLKSGWLPANLVQAQRDYFGAHTYERIDRSGKFHTHWESNS